MTRKALQTLASRVLHDLHKVGPVVAQYRAAAGVTQTALAGQLGITSVALSQIENGHVLPSVKTLEKLAGKS